MFVKKLLVLNKKKKRVQIICMTEEYLIPLNSANKEVQTNKIWILQKKQ